MDSHNEFETTTVTSQLSILTIQFHAHMYIYNYWPQDEETWNKIINFSQYYKPCYRSPLCPPTHSMSSMLSGCLDRSKGDAPKPLSIVLMRSFKPVWWLGNIAATVEVWTEIKNQITLRIAMAKLRCPKRGYRIGNFRGWRSDHEYFTYKWSDLAYLYLQCKQLPRKYYPRNVSITNILSPENYSLYGTCH